jgi:hypothetical protein
MDPGVNIGGSWTDADVYHIGQLCEEQDEMNEK